MTPRFCKLHPKISLCIRGNKAIKSGDRGDKRRNTLSQISTSLTNREACAETDVDRTGRDASAEHGHWKWREAGSLYEFMRACVECGLGIKSTNSIKKNRQVVINSCLLDTRKATNQIRKEMKLSSMDGC